MEFRLRTEYITLSQLLKAVDLASSGAEAKAILAEGGVLVNGEEDNRRGRKLRPGDVVRLSDGEEIRVN
ncbi:MAG: RNA-binding S4 domain-containing protein [Fimbriimonadaceae bacterium]|nr:RNA-binding S4 domain-containing protein [Fimbriimonadaceae bacterium]